MTEASNERWRSFTRESAAVMRAYRDGEVDIDEGIKLIDATGSAVDDEIVKFVANTLSEIGGFPGPYAELLSLLSHDPTRSDVLKLMHDPL